ncbi:AgmX/PglI C-terminal domain-containing protein [Agaribacter flavus]|uniref:AgmX/PglI C-terminal domain-containing protein n=1 Tax=Agaribacter flavus TaxID=1902781 RepID=A0ABV7FMW1_9ALTE
MTTIAYNSQLPWDSAASENARFSKISIACLLLTLGFAVYVSMRALPDIPREQKDTLPPQLARILQAKAPPPPPVPVEPEPVQAEPIPPEPEALEPQVTPEPVQVEPIQVEPIQPQEAVPELNDTEKVVQARESAKSKGVLALSDTLASMRKTSSLQNMTDTQQTIGGGQANLTQRDTIAAPELVTSGGVQADPVSSDIGALGQLEGRRTTEFVAASEGEAALATKRIVSKQQVVGNRDLDKIRQTLDANKAAVYALYRRALRQDPSIEGKLSVKLVILPDGSLSTVTLVDSELDAPELVEKLLQRIGLINFGVENVTKTELEYAYNFLPY